MHAGKVVANNKAANFMMLFSEYLNRAPPTRSLETNDETLKMPTSTPISLSLELNLARYIGRVGIRAKQANK